MCIMGSTFCKKRYISIKSKRIYTRLFTETSEWWHHGDCLFFKSIFPNFSKTKHLLMETHSSILAWRILWTEEPGGLQSDTTEWLTLSLHFHFQRMWKWLACGLAHSKFTLPAKNDPIYTLYCYKMLMQISLNQQFSLQARRTNIDNNYLNN